jgi:hypothetical protein
MPGMFEHLLQNVRFSVWTGLKCLKCSKMTVYKSNPLIFFEHFEHFVKNDTSVSYN